MRTHVFAHDPNVISDRLTVVDPADEAILAEARGTPLDLAQSNLLFLARAAERVHANYLRLATRLMTKVRARRVRRLRNKLLHSWRAIASATYDEWGILDTPDAWSPPSNQIMGMALCEAAAKTLGERTWP